MRKILYILLFIYLTTIMYSQSNSFFIQLSDKELGTFNDAITLIRLVFDEEDSTNNFLLNALWAAEKKLFKVTIPIDPKAVNPVISRKEFSYWLCNIAEIGGKSIPGTRINAYKRTVAAGIVYPGRGADDSFSGIELLDTFAYFDYYIRSNKIKLRYLTLPLFNDEYLDIPEWRVRLYEELDEQRRYEKKMLKERKSRIKSKTKEDIEMKTDENKINIKIVE